jgi:hypothetical protein
MLYKIARFFEVNVVFIQKDQVRTMNAKSGWVKSKVIIVVFYQKLGYNHKIAAKIYS